MNAFFNGGILRDSIWLLIKTLPVVLEVLILGLICSYVWGLILSLIRLSRFRALRYIAGAYIDFFRGLPLLLLFVFIYYGLGTAGLKINALTSGVLGLTLCYGAYSAEIFRAGIQAIHKGQTEAARSLGMTSGQAMRYVILPQAIKLVVPPLTNEFIAMIKDTSLMSVIAVPELLFRAKEKMGVVANPTPLDGGRYHLRGLHDPAHPGGRAARDSAEEATRRRHQDAGRASPGGRDRPLER